MSQFSEASDEDLQRLVSFPGKIHIIGQMVPRRPNCSLFASTLEYGYFKPGTKANKDFVYTIIKWPRDDEMFWYAISIDEGHRDLVHKVAADLGMKLEASTPMMIAGGREYIFPMRGPNVYVLSNVSDSDIYKGPAAVQKMCDVESAALERIYTDHERWLAAQGHDVDELKEEANREGDALRKWMKEP